MADIRLGVESFWVLSRGGGGGEGHKICMRFLFLEKGGL